jgi:hypothetical protein
MEGSRDRIDGYDTNGNRTSVTGSIASLTTFTSLR